MANIADKIGLKALRNLERNLKEVYALAARDSMDRAVDFSLAFFDNYQEQLAAYARGEYTDQEFKDWLRVTVRRAEGYEKIVDEIAQRAVVANQTAAAYINGDMEKIYALNSNYEAWIIEEALPSIDFHLVNEEAVRRLMLQENHVEFRTVSVNPVRDYQWNRSRIENEVTSSILSGKPIARMSSQYYAEKGAANAAKTLAEAFYQVQGNNWKAAIRNARTAYTSATNAGRLDRMEEAAEYGVEMFKVWKAARDDRTRASHLDMDGETVRVYEKFSNGLMYPGDPAGDPAEVYNCRCAMESYMIINGHEYTSHPQQKFREWIEDKGGTLNV